MKLNLKSLFITLALIPFSGCLELKGTLTVKAPVTLKLADGGKTILKIKDEGYQASIKLNDDENIVLDLGSHFIAKNDYVFLNKKVSLRTLRNGEQIYLTAEENGQAYDLQARYKDEVKPLGHPQKGTEECTNIVNNQFVTGTRSITFVNMARTYDVDADLIEPSSKNVVARFTGSFVKEERELISWTECK